MKCKECGCCRQGFFKSSPDAYVCIGVKEPFIINDINVDCTEYEYLRVARREETREVRPAGNNETVKRFDITIKLRGDNVYDLYLNGKWIASRGSHESILDEARAAIKESLLGD